MYTVICVDGAVRHPEPFATRVEADTFAEWGHCCTRTHTITKEVPADPQEARDA